MSDNQGDQAITHSRLSGNDVSFDIVRDYFGEDRKAEYTGKVSGDELVLRMPVFGGPPPPGGRPGGGGRDLTFKRVSTEVPKRLAPPPPKISLPSAPDVPSNGSFQNAAHELEQLE